MKKTLVRLCGMLALSAAFTLPVFAAGEISTGLANDGEISTGVAANSGEISTGLTAGEISTGLLGEISTGLTLVLSII